MNKNNIKKLVNKSIKSLNSKEKPKLKKLFLNMYVKITNILKSLFNPFRIFKSRIKSWFKTDTAKDFIETVRYIVSYGLIIWFILVTFFDYQITYMSIIHMLGGGSLVYIVHDTLSYINNIIRGKQ